MAYVVTEACIRCKYTDCVEVCPQQAFRDGVNFVVIDPVACVNCGICEMVCPVNAIYPDYGLPETQTRFRELNAELAAQWPPAHARAPLPDAQNWRDIREKPYLLDRAAQTE
jgi:ferredoxin